MAENGKAKKEAEKASLDSPVERVRDAAKWLIGAFAAVAVLLLGGTQVSGIGQFGLDDDLNRLAVAAAGFVVGLSATLYAILQNVRLLLPQAMTIGRLEQKDLRTYFDANPELLPGRNNTVEELLTRYREAQRAYEEADDEEKDATGQRYGEAEEDVFEVLKIANWKAIEALFDGVRWRLAVAAGLAALGIGVFAWAANPGKDEAPKEAVIAPAPVVAQLSVKKEERPTLRPILGARCLLSKVLVQEVGGKKTEPEVVVVPRRGCKSTRLRVSADIGEVTAVPRAELP